MIAGLRWRAGRAAGRIRRAVAAAYAPPVRDARRFAPTAVDAYWTEHTVNSRPFQSATESVDYLEWRSEQYPLCREFMELWGDHRGDVVLDYGCGPGDDLVGFLLYSRARRVIGIDASSRALELARQRIGLHRIDLERVELLRTGDASRQIPLADGSVDFVHCLGVLHHASHPDALLREFHRVLAPAGRANVMVYNRESVWFHLYAAYVKVVLEGRYRDLELEQAFARTTDGEACPISRGYRPHKFVRMAEQAGFAAEFVGGYLSLTELGCLERYGEQAIRDERLADEQRAFVESIARDESGLPMVAGKHAGIGGSYRLKKR
jgi:ubiquinone/menaquinone biosynthesis C-methylase UbiE